MARLLTLALITRTGTVPPISYEYQLFLTDSLALGGRSEVPLAVGIAKQLYPYRCHWTVDGQGLPSGRNSRQGSTAEC